MNPAQIMGIISTVALLVPLLLVLLLRLYRFKCFLALGIYYLLEFSYNLMNQNFIHVNSDFKKYFGIANNYLELPLMFTFMLYFSFSARLTKKFRYSVFIFLGFELIVSLIFGYSTKSMVIIMAPGLALLLYVSAWFSLRQIKIAIVQGKGTGKAIMISALLFVYGCYMLIYVFYYLIKSGEVADIYTVYFIAVTISSLLLSIGIIIENKRIRILEELKTTRKELNMLYSNSQTVKTVSLDPEAFKKNTWD